MLFSIKPELDQKFFQGTGLKHLQKPLLKDRPIYVPEKMELEAFNRQVMPMLDIISENTRENQQLTSLRDWLLLSVNSLHKREGQPLTHLQQNVVYLQP